MSTVLAHGALGTGDEVAALVAVPVVLLVLLVAHLRHRSQGQRERPSADDLR